MPDPRASLGEILNELHDVLEASGDLGDDARARLRDTAQDIERAIHPDAEPEAHSASLRERLTEALESFEGQHPRLTAIVGRIADQLSDMGI